MSLATVKCPNCGHRIPVPAELSESQEGRIACGNCGVNLRLQRKLAPSWKESAETAAAESNRIRIPGYRLMGRLGRGGMASVFSGVQTASGRLVAIKVLPPSSAANPDLVLRFEREAKMLASLTHPNVVQIVDRGQVGNLNYIVMEYIPGRTLKDRMDEEQIPIREVVDILTRIGEAIQHCHDHGLIHRDLKPGNILLTPSGDVKVTDFGISGLLRRMGDITEQGVLIGTPQYVAPEQLRDGSRVDHRADQFSLGVLAYEILTNCLPVGVFDPVSKRRNEVPPKVDAVLSRALARDPADRFRSVREFIHELRRAFHPILSSTSPGTKDSRVIASSDPATSPMPVRPELADALASSKRIPQTGSNAETETLAGRGGGGGRGKGEPALADAPTEEADSDRDSPKNPNGAGWRGIAAPPTPTDSGDPLALPLRDHVVARRRKVSAPSGAPPQSWKARWDVLALPHRVALIGLASLLVVGAGAFVLHGVMPASSTGGEGPVFLRGGAPAPAALGRPILEAAELDQAVRRQPCGAFLFSTRADTGEWNVGADLFADAEVGKAMSAVPLRLVDGVLCRGMTHGWKWEAGTGLVFAVNPPGKDRQPCMLLALVAPLDAGGLRRAQDMVRLAANTPEYLLPNPASSGSPNLLVNGDLSEMIRLDKHSGGWEILRSSPSPAIAPPSSDSKPVSSSVAAGPRPTPSEAGPFIALDAKGPILGIVQTAVLEVGREYALEFEARSPDAGGGWIGVAAGKTGEAGESPVWALSVEMESGWRRYQIRWVAGAASRDIALRARKNAVEIKDISLRRVVP